MFMEFTASAAKVMKSAKREAQRLNREHIQAGNVLLGLVGEGHGLGAVALKNLAVDLTKLRTEALKPVKSDAEIAATGAAQQTLRGWKVIEYACEEAGALGHDYVGTGHILLGLLRESEGSAAQALVNVGLKLEDVRQETFRLLESGAQDPDRNETD
jgi:ATP-dependent Clp protease ATP-binding subunit ClpC